jgi:copper(I)-binding protein
MRQIGSWQGGVCKKAAARRLGCALLVVVGLVVLSGAMPETQWKNIKIVNPWVYETDGARAVLHVTIANMAARADRLVRASTPIAASVGIWDQLGHDKSGLTIPGRAEFVIGTIVGYVPRIELIGLTAALRANTSFKLLLVFEHAGKISVDVTVDQAPAVKP